MKSVQFHAEIGPDGVLNLSIPFGQAEALMAVTVTIQPLSNEGNSVLTQDLEWHDFVNQTYGSCAGLGLEEPEDTPLSK